MLTRGDRLRLAHWERRLLEYEEASRRPETDKSRKLRERQQRFIARALRREQMVPTSLESGFFALLTAEMPWVIGMTNGFGWWGLLPSLALGWWFLRRRRRTLERLEAREREAVAAGSPIVVAESYAAAWRRAYPGGWRQWRT